MKNFKLLLASTAILSTGLAICAMADGETPATEPTGTGYARIEAKASFTSPIRLTASQPIYFGILDPKKGGEVTIEAKFDNPTIDDPNGAIIGAGVDIPRAGYINLTGGVISDDLDDSESRINDEDLDSSEYVLLALEDEEIELTETAHSGNTNNGSGETCGTVKNITQGMPRVNGTGANGALQIPLGGTLEINQDYDPSGNYGTCTGHTTVTYVVKTPW